MPCDVKHIDPLDLDDSAGYFDDYFSYNTGDMWTSLAADSGSSVAASDAHGGILILTTGGTDNNEAAAATTKAVLLPAQDRPVTSRHRAQFSNADSLAANVAMGMSNIFTANFITDNGAGLSADFSGAVFFKKDQDTYWSVASSNGTTQTITRTNITAGVASYAQFEVTIQPFSATQADVIFRYNGQIARDANGDPIKHTLTLTSLLAMKVGSYVKAGGSTTQTLNVDYAAFRMKRLPPSNT